MKKNKVLENTIMLYILTFSNYLFNFITVPYQTRVLGPEIYGQIGFALAFSTYFRLFFDFGFILSATEDVSNSRENNKKVSQIFSEVFFSKLVLILAGMLILVLLIMNISIFNQNKMLYILFFAYVAIDSLQPDFLYRGIENMKVITLRNVIIKFIFMILLFIFLKNKSQYLYVPLFNLCGSLIALAIVYIDVYKNLKVKIHKTKYKEVLNCIKKSSIFFLSRIATTLYGATNTFILGIVYPGSTLLGCYTASDKLLTASKSAFTPISDSIYPHMVKKKDFNIIKKTLMITMPFVFIGCVLLFIFAKQACVLLFGNEYTQSATILRYMIPIILLTLPSYLLGFPTMTPLGLKKEANYSVIIASIYHALAIGVMFIFKFLNIHTICILTITTEVLIVAIRIYYIIRKNVGENK